MIPFAAFEPDRSRYAMDATTVALNCVPVKDGWGPMPSLSEVSEALDGPCVGVVRVRNSSGSYSVIAGTAEGLYRLDTSTYAWDDISGSSAPYSVPDGDRWSFCQFGQYLVACNLNDPPQVYDIDAGGTFSDLAGSPPRAKYVWASGGFLVLGHLNGLPKRVQWSGIEDAGFWTVGLRGSDYQDMPDGGEITGGITGEGGAVLFQRDRIRAMTVTQDIDFAMQISVVNPYRGAIAPLSICSIGPGEFVYLSEDGFFRNAEGMPIGAERVDDWFWRTLDHDFTEEVRGTADPFKKIVWWRFRTVEGKNILIGYHWQLNRWCRVDADIGEMASLATPGLTWDGLDSLYGSIDDVDVPFDSRLFRGGALTFAAFNTDNKLCYFTGPAMAATLETADARLFPGARGYLQEARVITDARDMALRVGTSAFHGATVTWGNAINPSSVTGLFHTRRDGQLHRFRLNVAAGQEWTHAIGVEPRGKRTGKR